MDIMMSGFSRVNERIPELIFEDNIWRYGPTITKLQGGILTYDNKYSC
jgi:hypothetical protein